MRQERKIVTALFCDLVGFTARAEALDPEDVAALLAPYQARLKGELERYGGTVEKFIGDAVMALFGAPVAHEDDPERAVRAALQIRDFAETEQIKVRIGIATGEALVSLDAHPEQGETMATGDVINTAARIQTAAPVNGVLVGEATYRATERAIEYRDGDSIEAKGKLDRVRVWQAITPRARFGVGVFQTRRAPLVGRERERALLEAALSRARAERQPQLVTLVGAPGVGKSRLIYELWRIVDADPELIAWRQGRSLPYGQGVAFWALSEIVKAQAGILETETADETSERLATAVRALVPTEDMAWVERSLRPLVGLAGESDQSEERHAMTFAAWRRFFEALGEQSPAVVVFEDLQWADDGLLDFIDQLVDHVTGVPLIVVCSARPELLERRPGWGGGKREAMTISLAPLSDEATTRLIAALLERPLMSADQQAALLQHAGGNPLFAEEYIRMLLDREVTSYEVPATLQALVAARIDALPADEKEVLQQAAVLGKVFWTDAVGALSNIDQWQLYEKLHALERKEFIRREHLSAVAGARQYVFVHVLVRDGAYGQMPRRVRAHAHRRVAEWIESLPRDRAGDRAEMLTHHLVQAIGYGRAAGLDVAALIPRAAAALRAAGDRAWSLGAPASALAFFEQSRELEPAADDPHLLLRLGRALVSVRGEGEPELARVAAALRETDPATAAEAELLRGEIIWQRGDQQTAFPYFERAAVQVRDLPPSRQKAFVVSQVARFLVLAGRAREGRVLADDAIAMARELDDMVLLADVLTTRGIARANSAEDGWLDDLEKSLALNLEIKSWRAGRAYINLGSTLFLIAGDLERADRLIREALQFAEGLGIELAVRWCRANLVECAYHLGRWDEALALAEREIGNPEPHYMQPTCHRHRALIRFARGDISGALVDIDVSTERSRLIRDPQDVIPALASRAFILARSGDRAGATTALEDLQARGAWVERWGPASVLRALALVDLGRAQDVGREEHAGPTTPWQRAAVAIGAGDLDAAADALAAIGARAFGAEVHVQAARKHRAAGRLREADAQLERALAFYRSVGAIAAIQDCEASLATAR